MVGKRNRKRHIAIVQGGRETLGKLDNRELGFEQMIDEEIGRVR